MTSLPIIGRELRVSSRKRATHLSRLIVGCGAALVLVWLLLNSGAALPPQRLGISLFSSLSNLAFIACLLPGVLLLISAVNALFFLVTAWIRLRHDFRELATQHALDASGVSPSPKADETRPPSVGGAHGVRA